MTCHCGMTFHVDPKPELMKRHYVVCPDCKLPFRHTTQANDTVRCFVRANDVDNAR